MEVRRRWFVEIVSAGPESFGSVDEGGLEAGLEALNAPERTWVEDQLEADGLKMIDVGLGFGIGSLIYEAKSRRHAFRTVVLMAEILPNAEVDIYWDGGLPGYLRLMGDENFKPWQVLKFRKWLKEGAI